MKEAPSVLVVDDSSEIIALITAFLTPRGYRVTATNRPETAFELAKAVRPSLILSDACMPGISGPELILQLKADPQLAHVPVILMSGSGEPVSEGAAAFLAKPFSMSDVLSIVSQYLPGSVTR